jgi:hypothetical protein
VFPVRYELDLNILCRRNSDFKGLMINLKGCGVIEELSRHLSWVTEENYGKL